jgi:hypothetical protein
MANNTAQSVKFVRYRGQMQICIELTKAPGFADEHTRDINPEWRATSPKNR